MTSPCLSQRLDELDYCVVDLETTGFSPRRDAIVEIACVRVRPDGTVVDEFQTVIDPGRPIRGTAIHGLTDREVTGAPALADVSGHLARCLHGAVLTSYNLYFDYPFLESAWLGPLHIEQEVPRLCCMYLRGMVGLAPSRLPLAAALEAAEIDPGIAHSAHGDASATAQLLVRYLAAARDAQLYTFADLATRRAYKFVGSWDAPLVTLPSHLPLGDLQPRTVRPPPVHTGPISLPRSVDRVWDDLVQDTPRGVEEYLSCLCDALADRELTRAELDDLADCARFYDLDPGQLRDLHERLYQAIIDESEDSHRHEQDRAALRSLLGVDPPRPVGRGWRWLLALLALVMVGIAAAVGLGWL